MQMQVQPQHHRKCLKMRHLCEGLKSEDLKDLVKSTFEVDSYKSKTGDDADTVVLCFEVTGKQPATDLVNFIETGYDYISDADVSDVESSDNVFRVFVELERVDKIADQINDIIYGMNSLTGNSDWRFRYYKDFKSLPLKELESVIPKSADAYKSKVEAVFESDLRFFFRKSPLDFIEREDKVLTFKRSYNNPIKMEIIEQGTRTDILNNLAGTIRIDETSTSETMWLTKYFGDYNITKYDEHFVFENDNNVIVFKLIK